MEAHSAVERRRLEVDEHEAYVENLKSDLDKVEFNNIELVIKLRDVARDLDLIWSR
jgi:hypothetical protein